MILREKVVWGAGLRLDVCAAASVGKSDETNSRNKTRRIKRMASNLKNVTKIAFLHKKNNYIVWK